MAAGQRGPSGSATSVAGMALVLLSWMGLTAARAGEFDAPMQPIPRDGVSPSVPAAKTAKNAPDADTGSDPGFVSADRMAPEYPGDPGMGAGAAGPDDSFVDRTVDAVGSVSSTTNSILRQERP